MKYLHKLELVFEADGDERARAVVESVQFTLATIQILKALSAAGVTDYLCYIDEILTNETLGQAVSWRRPSRDLTKTPPVEITVGRKD